MKKLKVPEINKKDFLARCSVAFDMGLFDADVLKLMSRWADGTHRLLGGQIENWVEMLLQEKERTHNFTNQFRLANDMKGYNCQRLLALLTHPCQICATDTGAWHTRSGFCDHDKCACARALNKGKKDKKYTKHSYYSCTNDKLGISIG